MGTVKMEIDKANEKRFYPTAFDVWFWILFIPLACAFAFILVAQMVGISEIATRLIFAVFILLFLYFITIAIRFLTIVPRVYYNKVENYLKIVKESKEQVIPFDNIKGYKKFYSKDKQLKEIWGSVCIEVYTNSGETFTFYGFSKGVNFKIDKAFSCIGIKPIE
jgi:hypothetical protein